MMQISNKIILRPRFTIELNADPNLVLEAFEAAKNSQDAIKINVLDAHVFLKIPVAQQHFWSPQLHLEVLESTQVSCKVKGLFGPSPTVWTLFMFFHFVTASLFLGFGVWTYSNWSLDTAFITPLLLMVLMVGVWISLYISGRLGKQKGQEQMHELHDYMNTVLKVF
ncbi:GTP-binding protein [Flavobacteriaceae bacterium]|nr:GTP-binding protein [Flavobacteriaceae bacterium]